MRGRGFRLRSQLCMAYLLILPLALLILCPPIPLDINVRVNHFWIWLVVASIFFSIYFSVFKTNLFLKIFLFVAALNIFFSQTPFISQFAFVEIVLCAYIYLACSRIRDWRPVFNTLWCVLVVECILLFSQIIYKDSLLNFGLKQNICALSVGNPMQARSFFLILSAILIQDRRIKVNVRWIFICLIPLTIWYFFFHNVYNSFPQIRWPIWKHTLKLSLAHPFMGWGLGSYKIIFPVLLNPICKAISKEQGLFYNAHNFWLQLFFETGLIGVSVISGFMVILLWKCLKNGRMILAFVLINYSLTVHFPDRQFHTVFLLIIFIAYIGRRYVCLGE